MWPPQLGYRDKAWSVNQMGAAARRHGYGEACVRIINAYYGYTAMDVQEAFQKVREQVWKPAAPCASWPTYLRWCACPVGVDRACLLQLSGSHSSTQRPQQRVPDQIGPTPTCLDPSLFHV